MILFKSNLNLSQHLTHLDQVLLQMPVSVCLCFIKRLQASTGIEVLEGITLLSNLLLRTTMMKQAQWLSYANDSCRVRISDIEQHEIEKPSQQLIVCIRISLALLTNSSECATQHACRKQIILYSYDYKVYRRVLVFIFLFKDILNLSVG